MKDYIIRGMAANHQVRFFAAYSKNLVEEARKRHETVVRWPRRRWADCSPAAP